MYRINYNTDNYNSIRVSTAEALLRKCSVYVCYIVGWHHGAGPSGWFEFNSGSMAYSMALDPRARGGSPRRARALPRRG